MNPNGPSNLSLPPELLAQLRAQAQQGDVVVAIRPRYELRKALADAIAQASIMRGQLIQQAANLRKMAAEAEGSLQQIRAVALGKLPASIDPKMLPTEADVRDLLQLGEVVASLAGEVDAVAGLDPFDDPFDDLQPGQ